MRKEGIYFDLCLFRKEMSIETLRPRLLTKNFIQKITQEQKTHVTEIKTSILSGNFHVFIGVIGLGLILFIVYRYYEKKEREKQEAREMEMEEQERMEEARKDREREIEEYRKEQERAILREQMRREEQMKSMEVPGYLGPTMNESSNGQNRGIGERISDGLQVEVQFPDEVVMGGDDEMDFESIEVSPYSDMENKETPLIRN